MAQLNQDIQTNVLTAREAIQKQTNAVSQTPIFTEQQILSSQKRSGFLQSFAERQAIKGQQQANLRNITNVSQEFEGQVAKVAPELGQEPLVQREYITNKSILDQKIAQIQSKIAGYEKDISDEMSLQQNRDSEYISDRRKDIKVELEKLNAYKDITGQSKADVIRAVSTGYADQLAESRASQRESKYQFKETYEDIMKKMTAAGGKLPGVSAEYDLSTDLGKASAERYATATAMKAMGYSNKDITDYNLKSYENIAKVTNPIPTTQDISRNTQITNEYNRLYNSALDSGKTPEQALNYAQRTIQDVTGMQMTFYSATNTNNNINTSTSSVSSSPQNFNIIDFSRLFQSGPLRISATTSIGSISAPLQPAVDYVSRGVKYAGEVGKDMFKITVGGLDYVVDKTNAPKVITPAITNIVGGLDTLGRKVTIPAVTGIVGGLDTLGRKVTIPAINRVIDDLDVLGKKVTIPAVTGIVGGLDTLGRKVTIPAITSIVGGLDTLGRKVTIPTVTEVAQDLSTAAALTIKNVDWLAGKAVVPTSRVIQDLSSNLLGATSTLVKSADVLAGKVVIPATSRLITSLTPSINYVSASPTGQVAKNLVMLPVSAVSTLYTSTTPDTEAYIKSRKEQVKISREIDTNIIAQEREINKLNEFQYDIANRAGINKSQYNNLTKEEKSKIIELYSTESERSYINKTVDYISNIKTDKTVPFVTPFGTTEGTTQAKDVSLYSPIAYLGDFALSGERHITALAEFIPKIDIYGSSEKGINIIPSQYVDNTGEYSKFSRANKTEIINLAPAGAAYGKGYKIAMETLPWFVPHVPTVLMTAENLIPAITKGRFGGEKSWTEYITKTDNVFGVSIPTNALMTAGAAAAEIVPAWQQATRLREYNAKVLGYDYAQVPKDMKVDYLRSFMTKEEAERAVRLIGNEKNLDVINVKLTRYFKEAKVPVSAGFEKGITQDWRTNINKIAEKVGINARVEPVYRASEYSWWQANAPKQMQSLKTRFIMQDAPKGVTGLITKTIAPKIYAEQLGRVTQVADRASSMFSPAGYRLPRIVTGYNTINVPLQDYMRTETSSIQRKMIYQQTDELENKYSQYITLYKKDPTTQIERSVYTSQPITTSFKNDLSVWMTPKEVPWGVKGVGTLYSGPIRTPEISFQAIANPDSVKVNKESYTKISNGLRLQNDLSEEQRKLLQMTIARQEEGKDFVLKIGGSSYKPSGKTIPNSFYWGTTVNGKTPSGIQTQTSVWIYPQRTTNGNVAWRTVIGKSKLTSWNNNAVIPAGKISQIRGPGIQILDEMPQGISIDRTNEANAAQRIVSTKFYEMKTKISTKQLNAWFESKGMSNSPTNMKALTLAQNPFGPSTGFNKLDIMPLKVSAGSTTIEYDRPNAKYFFLEEYPTSSDKITTATIKTSGSRISTSYPASGFDVMGGGGGLNIYPGRTSGGVMIKPTKMAPGVAGGVAITDNKVWETAIRNTNANVPIKQTNIASSSSFLGNAKYVTIPNTYPLNQNLNLQTLQIKHLDIEAALVSPTQITPIDRLIVSPIKEFGGIKFGGLLGFKSLLGERIAERELIHEKILTREKVKEELLLKIIEPNVQPPKLEPQQKLLVTQTQTQPIIVEIPQIELPNITPIIISPPRVINKPPISKPPSPIDELVPLKIIPPILGTSEQDKKKIKKKSSKKITGYEVLVKRKGKFTPTYGYALSRSEAIALGSSKVLKSSAATFEIVTSTKELKTLGITPSASTMKLFRPSTAKVSAGRELYVQRRETRITTPEEKKQISFVGTQTRSASAKKNFGMKNVRKSPTTMIKKSYNLTKLNKPRRRNKFL